MPLQAQHNKTPIATGLADFDWDTFYHTRVATVDDRPDTYWLIIKPFYSHVQFFNRLLHLDFTITKIDRSSPFAMRLSSQLMTEQIQKESLFVFPIADTDFKPLSTFDFQDLSWLQHGFSETAEALRLIFLDPVALQELYQTEIPYTKSQLPTNNPTAYIKQETLQRISELFKAIASMQRKDKTK